MSFDPALWAMKDAPVVDVEEWAVLVCMAEHADDDGCNSMPSQSTIANRTKTSVPTVKRRIASLAERGVIARGDQTVAERYPADRRPVVWDLMIPFSWFPNVERIQEYRRGKGRRPLTPVMRPDLPAAPEKKRRADAGVTRIDRSSRAMGLEDPGVSESGGSSSDERGVLQFTTGVQEDLQPSPVTHPVDPPHKPPTASPSDASAPKRQRHPDVEAALHEAMGIATAYMDWWKRDRGLPPDRPIPDGTRVFNALVGAKQTPRGCSYITAALLQGYTSEQIRTALARWANPAYGRKPNGLLPAKSAWAETLASVAAGRTLNQANGNAHARPNGDAVVEEAAARYRALKGLPSISGQQALDDVIDAEVIGEPA